MAMPVTSSKKSNMTTTPKTFYRRPLPKTCIDFTSSEGKAIFSEALASGYMECYFKLISQYRTQDEPAYCGITSLVMALNALEVDPGRIWKGGWRWYHESMLDCCTPLEIAQRKGINMVQFVCLAKCNGLQPFAVSGGDSLSLNHLREEVKRITRREDVVFIASYSRRILGQTGDGHFSPIAGYHEGRDLVLILDTARFKYPPHWVQLHTLLEAMKPLDADTGKPRGYVLLSIAKDLYPPLLFRPSCEFSVDLKKGSLPPELLNFYQEWKRWLQTEMFPINSGTEDLVSLCMQQLLTMTEQGHFKIRTLCLTMPFNMCFGDAHKAGRFAIDCDKLHKSVRKVILALKLLFSEMESSKTFAAVKQFLSTKSKSENDLFLQMVQCQAKGSCLSECCWDATDCSEDDSQPKATETPECCGGCGSVTESSQATACDDESSMQATENETNCPCTFDVRPEHVATMFLFVWPHRPSSQEERSPCNKKCRLSSDPVPVGKPATAANANLVSTKVGKENHDRAVGSETPVTDKTLELPGSHLQTSSFDDVLVDFLQSDLEAIKGTYFKGEVKTMMTKFYEVLHYHCEHD